MNAGKQATREDQSKPLACHRQPQQLLEHLKVVIKNSLIEAVDIIHAGDI